jgi:hypothetical protein
MFLKFSRLVFTCILQKLAHPLFPRFLHFCRAHDVWRRFDLALSFVCIVSHRVIARSPPKPRLHRAQLRFLSCKATVLFLHLHPLQTLLLRRLRLIQTQAIAVSVSLPMQTCLYKQHRPKTLPKYLTSSKMNLPKRKRKPKG